MTPPKGPVLIDLDTAPDAPTPADAPLIVDAAPAPQGQAMQIAARMAARRMSWPGRLFRSAAGALLAFVVSLAAHDYLAALLARNAVLGWAATALVALAVLGGLALAVREAADRKSVV